MDPQCQQLSEQITRELAAAVASLSLHVSDVVTHVVTDAVTAAEKRLAHQAEINVEAVKARARLAVEGYAATLEGISRRLDDIDSAVNGRIGNHGRVLKNHSGRIAALERKRSS